MNGIKLSAEQLLRIARAIENGIVSGGNEYPGACLGTTVRISHDEDCIKVQWKSNPFSKGRAPSHQVTAKTICGGLRVTKVEPIQRTEESHAND
jgi:hypothetical protein